MIAHIYNCNKEQLLHWLRYDAGVNHPDWFGNGLKYGGLELQQIPEEYVELLWFLKNNSFKNYLNIGIGKGGSFLTETYIQYPIIEKAVAIDNSSYWADAQKNSIEEKIQWLKDNTNIDVQFYDTDSVSWLKTAEGQYDFIFIDGDHSYEGVKADFVNALPLLKSGGYVAFHDIASEQCPGVVQLWNEIKNNKCLEFIHSNRCGIGIWTR